MEELKKRLEEIKDEFKVVSVKEIPQGKKTFITLKTFQYILKNGKIINREKISKNGQDGSAVVVLPLTEDMETILVIQPRLATKEGIGIEFPAGYIDEGEEEIDAAMRELREETGYVPKKMVHLISYYQDQGCSGAYNSVFLALGCEKMFEQDLDRDEYINYIECPFKHVLSLKNEGIIKDANSIIAIDEACKYLGDGKK